MQAAAVAGTRHAVAFVGSLIQAASTVSLSNRQKAYWLIWLCVGSVSAGVLLLLLTYIFKTAERAMTRRQNKGETEGDPFTFTFDMMRATSMLALVGAVVALGGSFLSAAMITFSTAGTLATAAQPIVVASAVTAAGAGLIFFFSDTIFSLMHDANVGLVRPLMDNIGNVFIFFVTMFQLTSYYVQVGAAQIVVAFTTLPLKITVLNLLGILPTLFVQSMTVATDLTLALVYWLQNDPLRSPIPLYTTFNDAGALVATLWTYVANSLCRVLLYIVDGPILALQEPGFALSANSLANLVPITVSDVILQPIIDSTNPSVDRIAALTTTALVGAGSYVQNASTYQFNRWIYGNETTLLQYVNGTLPVPPGDDIIYLVRFLRSDYVVMVSYAAQSVLGVGFQALDVAFRINVVFSPQGASVFTFNYIREPLLATITALASIFDVLPTCNTNPPTFQNIQFGSILFALRAVVYLAQAVLDVMVGEFYDLVTTPFAVPGEFTAGYLQTPTNNFNAYSTELGLAADGVGCVIGLVQPALGNAVAGFIVLLLADIPILLLQTIAYVRYSLTDVQNAYVFDTIDVDSIAASLTRVGRIAEFFYQFEPGANPTTCRTRVSFFCMQGSGWSNVAAALISGAVIGFKSVLFLLRQTVLFFLGGNPGAQRVYNPDYRATLDLAYLGACQVVGAIGKIVPIPLPCFNTNYPSLCRVREYNIVYGQVDNCMATVLCKVGGWLVIPFNAYVILVMLVNAFTFSSGNIVVDAFKMMVDIIIFRVASPVCPLAHFFDCVLVAIIPSTPAPVVSDFICPIMAVLVYIYRILGGTLIDLVNLVLRVFLLLFGGGGADPARTILDIILGFLRVIGASVGQLILAFLHLALLIFFNLIVATCYIISPFTLFFLLPKCVELQQSIQSSLGAGFTNIVNDEQNRNYKRAAGTEPRFNQRRAVKAASADTPERARREGRAYIPFDRAAYDGSKKSAFDDDAQRSTYCTLRSEYETLHAGVLESAIAMRDAVAARFRATLATLTTESTRRGFQEQPDAHTMPVMEESDIGDGLEDVVDDSEGALRYMNERREELITFRDESAYASFTTLHGMCPSTMRSAGYAATTDGAKRYIQETTGNTTVFPYGHVSGILYKTFGGGPLSVGWTEQQLTRWMADYVYWSPESTCYTIMQELRDVEWKDIGLAERVLVTECVDSKAKMNSLRDTVPMFSWLPEDFLYNFKIRALTLGIQGVNIARVAIQWASDKTQPLDVIFTPRYQQNWNASGLSVGHYAAWAVHYPGPGLLPYKYAQIEQVIANWTLQDALKENFPEIYETDLEVDLAHDPILGPLELLYTFGASAVSESFGIQYNETSAYLARNDTYKYGSPYNYPQGTIPYTDFMNDTSLSDEYLAYASRLFQTRLHTQQLFTDASSFFAAIYEGTSVLLSAAAGGSGSGGSILQNYKRAYDGVVRGINRFPSRWPAIASKLRAAYGDLADEFVSHHPFVAADTYRTRRRSTEAAMEVNTAVQVLFADGAHTLVEKASAYLELRRNKTAPICIEYAAELMNRTYADVEIQFDADPELAAVWRDRCANETYYRATGMRFGANDAAANSTLSRIINDPRGFIRGILGPRTRSAETLQSTVYGVVSVMGQIASDLHYVIAGPGDVTDRASQVLYAGQHAPADWQYGTFAAAAAATQTAADEARFLDRWHPTALPARTTRAPPRRVSLATAEAEFARYKAAHPELERTVRQYMNSATAKTTGMSHTDIAAARRSHPLYNAIVAGSIKDYIRRTRPGEHVLPESAPDALKAAQAMLLSTPRSAAFLKHSMFGDIAMASGMNDTVRVTATLAETSAELVRAEADASTLAELGWLTRALRGTKFNSAPVSVAYTPHSRVFGRRHGTYIVLESEDKRTTRATVTFSPSALSAQSVTPIDIAAIFYNITDCGINVEFLCTECLIATYPLAAAFRTFNQFTAYYLDYWPAVVSQSLPFLAYTLDSNAIVISGSGDNPPRVLSPTYSVGSYYRFWPEEIQNGVSLTKWVTTFLGPLPPYSANGTLYLTVEQYWQDKQAAADAGTPFVDRLSYDVLGYMQFVLGIDILNFFDTYIGYAGDNINSLIIGLYQSTLMCPATAYNAENQVYSLAAGAYVTTVWVGAFCLALGALFYAIGASIWTVLPIFALLFPFSFLIITYRWSLRCILPPAQFFVEAFFLWVLSVSPKCDGIIGTFISSPGWNAATCYDASATWEFAQCPAYFNNMFDVLAYYQHWLGLGPMIPNFLSKLFGIFGLPNAPTRDWTAVDLNDPVLYANLGGCSILAGAALVPASVVVGAVAGITTISVAVGALQLVYPIAVFLMFLAQMVYVFLVGINFDLAVASQISLENARNIEMTYAEKLAAVDADGNAGYDDGEGTPFASSGDNAAGAATTRRRRRFARHHEYGMTYLETAKHVFTAARAAFTGQG